MQFEDLFNLAFLAFVIGLSTMIKGCRKLRDAELLAAKVRHELADCEQARRELQEFAVLFNYGAREEAYEHLMACGFKTVEPHALKGRFKSSPRASFSRRWMARDSAGSC